MSGDSSGCCLGSLIKSAGFLLLIVIAFSAPLFAVISAQDPQQAMPPSAASNADMTDEQKAQYAASRVYGSRIIASRAGKYPTFDVMCSGLPDTIRTAANADALRLLREIRQIRDTIGWEFEDIHINHHARLIDVYGNESVNVVLGFGIRAVDIDKINFDNMLASNIPKIAIDWYEHPAMKK